MDFVNHLWLRNSGVTSGGAHTWWEPTWRPMMLYITTILTVRELMGLEGEKEGRCGIDAVRCEDESNKGSCDGLAVLALRSCLPQNLCLAQLGRRAEATAHDVPPR